MESACLGIARRDGLKLLSDGIGQVFPAAKVQTLSVRHGGGQRFWLVTNPATGIDTWADYTEYGQPTTPTTTAATAGGAAGAGYGWLGAHERATLDALGITLMGARLYNQATGLFTSLDPEYQGGDTAYGYPTDPVNGKDLAGTSWWNRTKNFSRNAYRNRRSYGRRYSNWYFNSRGGRALQFGCSLVRSSWLGGGCAIADGVANVSRYGWRKGAVQAGYNLIGGRFAGHFGRSVTGGMRRMYVWNASYGRSGAARRAIRITTRSRWYSKVGRAHRYSAHALGRSVQAAFGRYWGALASW